MCVCVCVCVCVHVCVCTYSKYNSMWTASSSSTHMCLLDNDTPYSIELTVSSGLAGICSCSMLYNILLIYGFAYPL